MGGMFQPMHLIIILIIALVIFGPGRLPELGSALGKSIKGFKKALAEEDKDQIIDVKKENTAQDEAEKKG